MNSFTPPSEPWLPQSPRGAPRWIVRCPTEGAILGHWVTSYVQRGSLRGRYASGSSVVKESACNAEDPGSIPVLERSPGEGKVYPLQYSGLKNPVDRGAWQATVHGVAKSRTLSEPLSLSGCNWHIPPLPPKSVIDRLLYFPSPLPVLCF